MKVQHTGPCSMLHIVQTGVSTLLSACTDMSNSMRQHIANITRDAKVQVVKPFMWYRGCS